MDQIYTGFAVDEKLRALHGTRRCLKQRPRFSPTNGVDPIRRQPVGSSGDFPTGVDGHKGPAAPPEEFRGPIKAGSISVDRTFDVPVRRSDVPVKRSFNSGEGHNAINGLQEPTIECHLIPTIRGRVSL